MSLNGRKEIVITCHQERPVLLYQMDDKPYDLLVGEWQPEEVLEVGDIFVGRVQNIVQNINAAFVEVKKGVVCYLPMSECGGRKVRIGDELVVQVKKAAVKTKQAVVTLAIEFVGTYCVVTTQDTAKGISQKIIDEDMRNQLKEVLQEFDDMPYGLVLRTNACETSTDIIRDECKSLSCELQKRGFVKVELYDDASYPLEKLLGIETKLEKALAKRVWLKSGGNLVIEPTEALTVIDVNTGKAIDGKRNKETTFFKLNCEAAREVARQIRLRSMSGIILVDFIDMQKKEHKLALMDLLREELKKDKTRTALVDITKLGLVEITRMKKNPPLWEMF